MKTFFASDLHFGHKNILRYEPARLHAVYEKVNFKGTFEEFQTWYAEQAQLAKDGSEEAQKLVRQFIKIHDEYLVEAWNSVVSNEDTVWFLGDLALSPKLAAFYAPKLNGRKYMILGNHDTKSLGFYADLGFKAVYRHPVILKQHFILSHAPISKLMDQPGLYQIYGHVHSNKSFPDITMNSICACLERHNLRPFELPEFDETTTPDADFSADHI